MSDNTPISPKSHNQSNKPNPHLKIIIGPMFSGKTTELIRHYQLSRNPKKVIINHSSDKRYNDIPSTTTHNKVSLPAITMINLKDIFEDNTLLNNDEFYIDEGQFYNDLYDVVIKLMDLGKKIIVCGLDGDFEKKPFGNMDLLKLITYTCDVNKLNANCYKCNEPAYYTKRLNKNKDQFVVGTDDDYQPSCYNHHKTSE